MKKEDKRENLQEIFRGIILCFVILAFILGVGSFFNKSVIEIKQRIVINKTIEINKGLLGGHTCYIVAYDDSYYQIVNYGEYSSINVGDTVYFEKRILNICKDEK